MDRYRKLTYNCLFMEPDMCLLYPSAEQKRPTRDSMVRSWNSDLLSRDCDSFQINSLSLIGEAKEQPRMLKSRMDYLCNGFLAEHFWARRNKYPKGGDPLDKDAPYNQSIFPEKVFFNGSEEAGHWL